MAHFAHLNSENKVMRISVVSNDIETSDGPLGENNMHVDGETWCQNFHGGKPWTVDNGIVSWKQCSYNGSFRKAYPQIGATYDSVRDEFVQPKPYPSWSLNEDSPAHLLSQLDQRVLEENYIFFHQKNYFQVGLFENSNHS